MKRLVVMTTVMTTAVLMACATFADEVTHSTVESNRVTVTPPDPIAPPAVQERSSVQTEHRSSTMTDPLAPSVQERSHVQTEHRSSTVTSDPLARPSVQERSSDSYKAEERSSSTSDPLDT